MKTFRLSDANVRVELFAAEPNVVDPAEVVFDENGRWKSIARGRPRSAAVLRQLITQLSGAVQKFVRE